MKKIVVIGGGTAGWLTAIFAKFMFSENVTVISSSAIDILGAGEGSTPNLMGMLKNFKIDIDDFIAKTGASIKAGITFENWDPSMGGSFDHLFNLDGEQKYGIHFNARKTADYLENYAMSVGIKKIDKIVKTFINDSNGDIVSITMDDDTKIDSDFIFDCTGFQRLVIGKHYKSEWISYSDKLICNKAFGFFLPQTNNVTKKSIMKTKAIAMKNGWMWGIPLQNRFGCGYSFSDQFTTVEEAKKEAEAYLNREIEIVKVFDFSPGSFKETWINNTIALGLSSGFVEPLEATSIMGLIISLDKLNKYNIFEKNKENIEDYNRFVISNSEQIVTFLMHHYNCGRNDSPFWEKINQIELPEVLKKIRSEQPFEKTVFESFFNVKNDKLIFGEKNYATVTGGHKSKKIEKTLI
jgi:tryptophan halogenase